MFLLSACPIGIARRAVDPYNPKAQLTEKEFRKVDS
jgi:hypothetical protein